MTTVLAYAAPSATEDFTPITITRRDPGEHDVVIDIAYCGICHSDIHTVRGEWGPQRYPLVPGHEFTGVVSAVGTSVTRHRVGDRVGVGCMADSCRTCPNCLAGAEQHCVRGNVPTYGGKDRDGTITQGGYSQKVVVDESFVVRVPAELPLDEAAPLLCAGITTYSPLARWGVGQGTKVGVIGLGGLGHLAVKLAVAMGAEVHVLSHSGRKREDALRFGATGYHDTSEEGTLAGLTSSLDLVLNTVSGPIDLESYLGLLRLNGVFVAVGATIGQPITFPTRAIATNRRVYSFSMIGGIPETQGMLDFCAAHGVRPQIETISAEQISAAYDRVVDSDVRYRFVIDASTIG